MPVGHECRVLAVGESPDRIAVAGVQRPRSARPDLDAPQPAHAAPPARGEVDEAGEHRGSSGDRGRRTEPPARGACSGVERDEVPVPGPDEDGLPPDSRSRVDVRPHLPRPQEVTAARTERVHRPIRVPDVDAPVGDRRRRVEVLPPAEARERGRVPALLSGLGVDAVDAPAARCDNDQATRPRRRRHDLVVRGERPLQERPALAADPVRVQVPVPGAEIEHLPDEQRRRLDRAGAHAPVLLAVARVPGDHEPGGARLVLPAGQVVHVALVDDALRDRRRRRGAVREMLRPDDLPGPSVERVKAALLLRDVHLPVRDRRRELDIGARLQLPEPVVRRPEAEPGRREVRPLRVVAVRRPLLARARPVAALRRLPRLVGPQRARELGRRAEDRARTLLVPRPGRQGGAGAEGEYAEPEQAPAQETDAVPQQDVEDREHDRCPQEELRGVRNRAFERGGERQDPEQVSDDGRPPRRLPVPSARSPRRRARSGPWRRAPRPSGPAACRSR